MLETGVSKDAVLANIIFSSPLSPIQPRSTTTTTPYFPLFRPTLNPLTILYSLQIQTPLHPPPSLPFPFSSLAHSRYNSPSPASLHQNTVRWCSWLSRQSNIPVRITEGLQFKSGSNHHSDLKDLFLPCPPGFQGNFFSFRLCAAGSSSPAVDTLPHQGDWEPGSSRCGRFCFFPLCGSFVHTAAASGGVVAVLRCWLV
jgi:hypothetical protein